MYTCMRIPVARSSGKRTDATVPGPENFSTSKCSIFSSTSKARLPVKNDNNYNNNDDNNNNDNNNNRNNNDNLLRSFYGHCVFKEIYSKKVLFIQSLNWEY
jgi:hypothetical protein